MHSAGFGLHGWKQNHNISATKMWENLLRKGGFVNIAVHMYAQLSWFPKYTLII